MRVPLLLLLALSLAACAGRPPACPAGTAPWQRADLYFGTGDVPPASWQDFLAREITPRFPDGLTVLDAAGQWRDPADGRITAEPARVVEILFPPAPSRLAALAEIRAAYRARFAQQSVGLALSDACAGF
jgi:hypothetical protein